MNTIATKAGLATIRPIDCPSVEVEEDGRTYDFDYTSTRIADGVDVIEPGIYPPEQPEPGLAGQPFMAGHWVART